MDARDDEIEPGQKLRILVQCPVLQDVDLDPAQQQERSQRFVDVGNDPELLDEALR